MAGLLDFEDPQQAGLLALAQGLFAAGAPQNRRVGLGEALAGGMGNMQQAQMQAEMLRRKKQEQDMQNRIAQMKMDEMQKAIAEQQTMKQAMIDYAKQRNQLAQPKEEQFRMDAPLSDYQKSAAPNDMPSFYGKQPAPQQAQTMQQPSNPVHARISELNNVADFMESRGISGDQYRAKAIELQKLLPKYANEYRVGRDAKGNLVNIRLGDDGSEQYSPTQVAEELHYGDNGQQLIASGKYSGRTQLISPKYQTPESIASNATSMRIANMTDARARDLNEITRLGQQTQVINDPNQGILLVDKGTGFTRKTFDQQGSAIPSEAQSKKTSAANNILPIISQAEKLIDKSTGSYAGAAIDQAGRLIGSSTKGADAIAELKVLEGAIMMNQPRFEGPQSDKDVAMYRQLAGQIGDPTVPADMRKAALNQLKQMHLKNSTGGSAKEARTVVRTGRYGGKKVVEYSDGSVEYGN